MQLRPLHPNRAIGHFFAGSAYVLNAGMPPARRLSAAYAPQDGPIRKSNENLLRNAPRDGQKGIIALVLHLVSQRVIIETFNISSPVASSVLPNR
jgi:hypothetical protein